MKKSLVILAVMAAALCAGIAQAAGVDLSTFITPDVALGLGAMGGAGMINFHQKGEVLDLTPSAAVAKGEGYLHGTALFGVAVDAVASGAEGRFVTEGVVTIAKTSALAIAVGDRLFWDATNKVVNKTVTAQMCVGVATEAAANPSSTVKMKIGRYVPVAT